MRTLLRLLLVITLGVAPMLVWAKPAHAVSVTATTAGTKIVTTPTQVWGTAAGAPGRPVRVEALVTGRWSVSRTGTTSGTGSYALPLTYGMNTPGTYTYRVGVTLSTGVMVYSGAVTLTRVNPSVTAVTAGRTHVGATANIWGNAGLGSRPVNVQVLRGEGWTTINTGRTTATGGYVVALTFGAMSPGTYTFRTGVTLPTGVVVYSPRATLQRLPISVTATTAGVAGVGIASYVWGTAAGAAGRPISLQALVNANWVTVNTGSTASTGAYRLLVNYGAGTPGTYTYRVVAHSVVGGVASRSVTLTRPACLSVSAALRMSDIWYSGLAIQVYSLHCVAGNTWALGEVEIWNDDSRTFTRGAWLIFKLEGSTWKLTVAATHAGGLTDWRPGTANYWSAPPEIRAWIDTLFDY